MQCIICNSKSKYYFSKTYNEEPFKTFMNPIGEVKYYKCTNCGFTMSKTHHELSLELWEKLNLDYHTHMEEVNKQSKGKGRNPPPYFEIAFMLNVLSKNTIIDANDMLDFAGGYGTLSNILNKYFSIDLPVYDPFVQNNDRNIYIQKSSLRKYNTIINSALFEHVTSRKPLDEINNLVNDDGCMIIHTVIAENIPNNEDWFYIRRIPVHCAFHTNRSMEILMEQWGYIASLYCPTAKSWILFKKVSPDIEDLVGLINIEFQTEYLVYKKGFVDYWKGF